MEKLLHLVIIVVAAYGLLVLVVYFSQPRLLYNPDLPTRSISATPGQIGLVYEQVQFITDDGLKLHGWFLPSAGPSRGTLLFFHGNSGNISHRLDSLRIFNSLGLAVLIFDYRGYGQSEGQPSEQGSYRDAEAAWNYLTDRKGIPADEILLFGRSLGGAVAANLASRHPSKGLILESTFTSIPDLAAELYPMFPARWLSRYRYDTHALLPAITTPLLVMHSREDEIIPFHHGQSLYQAAQQPKQFLLLQGTHNEAHLQTGDEYLQGLEVFIQGISRDQNAVPAGNGSRHGQ